MSELAAPTVRPPHGYFPQWLWAVFLRPRQTFRSIAEQTRGVWLGAMLAITLVTIVRVVVAAPYAQTPQVSGEAPEGMPPGYYSPEQQAQFDQAAQVASGPVFRYVMPAVAAVAGVWVAWLVVGGSLHLLLTLFGARGDTLSRMNLTAWAGLPFALREVVRIAAMLIGGAAITAPGLSGFVAADASGLALYIRHFLALIDIYMAWHIVLLIIGSRAADPSLRTGRFAASVVALITVLYLLQALLSFGLAQLGNLGAMQPFF